jgi:hypothetical protein
MCVALIWTAVQIACSDPAPPPHALLPGQSNSITALPRSAPPQKTEPQPTQPIGPEGFVDKFDRPELGPDWLNTGAPYRIEQGHLAYILAHNHPLWLNRILPRDLQVEFDCASGSPDGDIKVELFGDGHTFESDEDVQKDVQYTATGYVFILGGWKNRLSTLVKQREHAWQQDKTVPRNTEFHIQPGRPYHFTITRINSKTAAHFDWKLDNQEFLSWDDPQPLDGPGHDRFAFEGWESPIACANLKITPLPARP